MSLASLFPGPQPITLAGKSFVVSCWRLRDILDIERWLAARVSNPLDGFPSVDEDSEPSTRKRRLRAVMSIAGEWPPNFGSEQGHSLLATAEGQVFFLCTALDRDNPDVTPDDLLELMEAMDVADWRRLTRALWQSHPQEEILREVTPWRFDDGEPIHWPQVIDRLSTEREMSYEAILDLSLPVVFNMLSGGEKRCSGLKNPSEQGATEFRRAFLDDDEIPAFEAREAELFAEMKANEARAKAEANSPEKHLERDAIRLGMNPVELATSLAGLDAQVAELEAAPEPAVDESPTEATEPTT